MADNAADAQVDDSVYCPLPLSAGAMYRLPMLRAAALIILLIAAPAAADEWSDFERVQPDPPSEWRQEGGQTRKIEAVPYPLPAGYERCVRVIVFPEHIGAWGRINVFEPPLDAINAFSIDYVREHNIGRVEHCGDSET